MFKNIKKIFLKRSIVLGLIIILTISFILSNILPQVGTRANESSATRDITSGIIHVVGLDHIFSTWWFVLFSVLFLISLIFSTYDQFRAALTRVSRAPVAGCGGAVYSLAVPVDSFKDMMKSEGYHETTGNETCVRYVKARWGYWGSFSLHLGMTVTVLFSLIYVVTEHRAMIRTIAGDIVPVEKGNYAERGGIFSGEMRLPAAIRLQSLKPAFWDNDQLKSLSSELVFLDKEMRPSEIKLGINDKADYQGIIIYQRNSFGNIFLLEFNNESGPFTLPIMLPIPSDRKAAGYGNFEIDGGRYMLMAKYYTSPDRKNMMPDDPQLVLRLYENERMLGELSLLKGASGKLGPYSVKVLAVSWWADLIFEGSRGMYGIFAGFFLMLCGGMLGYFVVPREVLLCRNGKEYNITWRATKFSDFYREESERIMSYCKAAS